MPVTSEKFVERHFGGVLLLAFLAGLFAPGLDAVPAESVVGILALIIFISSFKIEAAEVSAISPQRLAGFYLLRFVALPFALWNLLRLWSAELAVAALLLALMPAGVSAPAFAGVMGGNVAVALALVVTTTLLTPLLVPMVFLVLSSRSLALDVTSIFLTLGLAVVVPILLHLPFRRWSRGVSWIKHYGSALSIICISVTMALVLAKRRSIFFENPLRLIAPILIGYGVFVLFYAFGELFRASSRADRIAFSLASGTNNLALGISLALLYFPPDVAVFLVLCELPWMTLLIPYRWWVSRRRSG